MKYFQNCLHHTSAVPQPYLLLIAANLAQAGFLGWKWSLWPVPIWLEVQQRKAVFFLALYDSINDMKYWRIVCITPQPCHSHICCWLLPIWPKLDFWAENGAYGMCWIGWRYNGAKLSCYWPYMIVSMIWNTSELSASHRSLATAIFVVDCCQFGPSWMFILSMIWNTSELCTSHRILPWSSFTHKKKSAWDTIYNTPNVELVLKMFELYSNILMTIMN